jgi:hypothetical protein
MMLLQHVQQTRQALTGATGGINVDVQGNIHGSLAHKKHSIIGSMASAIPHGERIVRHVGGFGQYAGDFASDSSRKNRQHALCQAAGIMFARPCLRAIRPARLTQPWPDWRQRPSQPGGSAYPLHRWPTGLFRLSATSGQQ